RAVGHRRGIPADRIGRGGVLAPERGAVQQKLHADHADVIAGVGGNGDRPRHARTICGRRHGNRGRGGVDHGGDGEGGRGRNVAGGIACAGFADVGAVGGRRRIPGDRERRRGVLRAEGHVIEQELDAGDPDVIAGVGRNGDGPGQVRARGRGGQGDRGRRRVV